MLPNPKTNNFIQIVKEPFFLRLYDNENRNFEPSKVAFTIDFGQKPKTLVQSFDELQEIKLNTNLKI